LLSVGLPMKTSDRPPNPGKGYRLLDDHECPDRAMGDQWWDSFDRRWRLTLCIGKGGGVDLFTPRILYRRPDRRDVPHG
jgi:hypothetical protein